MQKLDAQMSFVQKGYVSTAVSAWLFIIEKSAFVQPVLQGLGVKLMLMNARVSLVTMAAHVKIQRKAIVVSVLQDTLACNAK